MTGFALEAALHWAAVAAYAAATAVLACSVFFDRPAAARAGRWVASAGLLPHAAALLHRWVEAGHGPYLARYEVLSSSALVAVAMLLVFLWRRPAWAAIALVALPVAFLMIAVGLFTDARVTELPATFRPIWLVFHISFAKLATGGFLLSFAGAVVLIRKAGGRTGPILDRLPAADALDAATVRFAAFGFLFWTISVAAGAIWAHESWGRYWGWDPIETWSLVTWLCYGAFLHARVFFRLRGRAIAWASIACFAVAVGTVFALPFLMSSLHVEYFR